MSEETTLQTLEERIEIANPQHPHCATVLVLDTSGSMAGDKIRQLNEGVRFFVDDVSSDDLARKRVDLAVFSFAATSSCATILRRRDSRREASSTRNAMGRRSQGRHRR